MENLLQSVSLTPNEASRYGLNINKDGQRRTAFDLLSYSEVSLDRLSSIWPEIVEIPVKLREALETEAQYSVYMERQSADIAVVRREEERLIPDSFDYSLLPGLSNELKQKLGRVRPRNLAQLQQLTE